MTDAGPDALAEGLSYLARANEEDFEHLARTAGLSPEHDFRRANLSEVDLRDQDLRAFDLSHALFVNALVAGAQFNATASLAQLVEAQDYRAPDNVRIDKRVTPSLPIAQQQESLRSNSRTLFADLVFIDAWMVADGKGPSRANLYIDANFGTARVSIDGDTSIRFRLSLRQADVVVVIPHHEPAKVDPSTVWRAPSAIPVKTRTTVERKTVASQAVSKLGAEIAGSVKASLGGSRSTTRELRTEIVSPVEMSMTSEGDYRWTVRAYEQATLTGRLWDSDKRPLLRVVDTRVEPHKGLPPAIRVEVRCRREDLVISEIQTVSEGFFRPFVGPRNRLVAAEAVIRNSLAQSGLAAGDLSDPYTVITLASTAASTEAVASREADPTDDADASASDLLSRLQGLWTSTQNARVANNPPCLVSQPSAYIYLVPAAALRAPRFDLKKIQAHRQLLAPDGAAENARGQDNTQWWAHGPTRHIGERPNPEADWSGRLLRPGVIEQLFTLGRPSEDDTSISIDGFTLEQRIVATVDRGLEFLKQIGFAGPTLVAVSLYELERVRIRADGRVASFRQPSLGTTPVLLPEGTARSGQRLRDTFDGIWLAAGFPDGSPSYAEDQKWIGYA